MVGEMLHTGGRKRGRRMTEVEGDVDKENKENENNVNNYEAVVYDS